MQKEHGQVTGLIWRGSEDLQTYAALSAYAKQHDLTTAAAAKQLIHQMLIKKEKTQYND